MVKSFVEFEQNVNQLAVFQEYTRHEGMIVCFVTTSILVEFAVLICNCSKLQ